jgi:NAD(P)-dependent dehydrogenase (short-subunit alcohol dehydrogenase family)
LVNAAGIMNLGRQETYFDEKGEPNKEYDEIRETDYTAPLRLTKKAITMMRPLKEGVIVNISSTKEFAPDKFHVPYTFFKAKLSRVTEKIANYGSRFGVRIVDLQPGNTKTNIERGLWTKGNNEEEMMAAKTLHSWWRSVFGNRPETVADAIYKIVEGEIKETRVRTGIDAHLMYFLHENIPGWERIFGLGYNAALAATKLILKAKSKFG